MSPHCAELRRQILHEGKRSWTRRDHAGDDDDVFFTHYVVPLRELQADGLFERLEEIKVKKRGNPNAIIGLKVEGAINFDHELIEDDAPEEADDA